MPDGQALVETRALIKKFGPVTAVDNVSFCVGRGEVIGFLGPNGAGKSTTMKIIAGFLEPTSGDAFVAGHDSRRDPIAARRHLGYLPEGAPAYPDMTVADFLGFVAGLRGLSPRDTNRRLAELVESIDLAEVWNRRIEALSKGYKRRVGIAQALVHDPDVLILDEPTDGLDPNQKHEIRALIRTLAPSKAIIVSTHILEEVEAICTRAIVIARGRKLADTTPAALLAMAPPRDPNVPQLVKTTPLEDAFRHITLEQAGV
jgi:ABC-2 type transport system ATP-binding protein